MARDQEITKHSRIFTKPELPFYLTIWCTVFLSALGLTMVLSASTVTSLQENGNSYTIFLRQTLFLLIGFAAAYWAYRVKGVFWIQVAKFSLIISIFTLLLPFISFIGKDVKGNRNWIEFAGFTLQHSEFAKFGLFLWCAL